MPVDSTPQPSAGLKPGLRLIGLIASTAATAAAIYSFRIQYLTERAWWLLAAAFLLAVLWQSGLELEGARAPAPVWAPNRRRVLLGTLLTAAGGALWVWAPYGMYKDWEGSFDRSWIAWLVGTVLLGSGLDLLWGRWPAAPAAKRWRPWLLLLLTGFLAISAVYRLGNVSSFPGEAYSTQIEDVMAGMWGQGFVEGVRSRWEFLSHIFTIAAGLWLWGPTLTAMRTALGIVSTLKTIPVFLWLYFSVGPLAAAVGTGLLVCSSWDVVFSRIPQPNQILPAIVFALLAGPARRGRPSAYVWLGFVGGYLLYEYLAFRPLILFILAATAAFSLRDSLTRWPLRLVRPTVTLLLIVSMGVPLFLNRLNGIIEYWYFDGFHRATGYQDYYNPNDSWQLMLEKRINRAASATELFFFRGDANPVHNIRERPQIDPVTATLMLFGIAYGLTHLLRSVFGLTAVGFLLGVAGTLVVTGNWDVARAATTMVYPYALAGFGAAAVAAVFEGAWRRHGRTLAAVLLVAALPVAGYLNTAFLFDFWKSPEVRRAMRNNLALLSSFLHQNVQPGERAVLIAPGYTFILNPNDAMWMRGPIAGIAVADIETAVRDVAANPGPTLLVVFGSASISSVQTYLEWLIPGLHMQFVPDQYRRGGELAYAHLTERPPDLEARIAASRCMNIEGEYQMLDGAGAEVFAHVIQLAPFIDDTTVSGQMQDALDKLGPKVAAIRVRFQATIVVTTPGTYAFRQEGNAVRVGFLIDGQVRDSHEAPVELSAGPHRLEIEGNFRGLERAQFRLLWKGPDTHEQAELMPLYRLAEVNPSCVEARHEDSAAPDHAVTAP